jgi:hypothetical protein
MMGSYEVEFTIRVRRKPGFVGRQEAALSRVPSIEDNVHSKSFDSRLEVFELLKFIGGVSEGSFNGVVVVSVIALFRMPANLYKCLCILITTEFFRPDKYD